MKKKFLVFLAGALALACTPGCLRIGGTAFNPPITSFLRKSDIREVSFVSGTNSWTVKGYQTDGGQAVAAGALQFGTEVLKRFPPVAP